MRKPLKKMRTDVSERKLRRKMSVRSKIIGTTDRPRLCVVKSNKNLSVQVVDDSTNKTLFSMHTFGKNAVKGASKTIAGSKVMGEHLADKLKSLGIQRVVFDRNGLKFTGALASIASSIKEHGVSI